VGRNAVLAHKFEVFMPQLVIFCLLRCRLCWRCFDTSRSITGYLFMMGGGAISWSSKRQATVATSTVEAEHVAAAAAVREGLWVRRLAMEFGLGEAAIKILGASGTWRSEVQLPGDGQDAGRHVHQAIDEGRVGDDLCCYWG
jgi:hypothetical protein